MLAEYRPALHCLHAVWPVSFWYEPGGMLAALHRVHSDDSIASLKLPGAHGDGWVERVAHAAPAGHAVQLPACDRPVSFE